MGHWPDEMEWLWGEGETPSINSILLFFQSLNLFCLSSKQKNVLTMYDIRLYLDIRAV